MDALHRPCRIHEGFVEPSLVPRTIVFTSHRVPAERTFYPCDHLQVASKLRPIDTRLVFSHVIDERIHVAAFVVDTEDCPRHKPAFDIDWTYHFMELRFVGTSEHCPARVLELAFR